MVNILLNDLVIEDIDLMIFDKDGTLIDLYIYWSNMIRFRAESLQKELNLSEKQTNELIYEMGVDENNLRLRPEGPVGVKKREIVTKTAADYLSSIGHKNTMSLCIDIFKKVDAVSTTKFDEIIKPIDGLYELIKGLKDNNCKIAIATTDKTKRAELAIKFIKIDYAIDMIVGADDVKNGKPSPEMIEEICKNLNISQSNTAMIGDAITDVEMGINAKVKASIGVATGITPKHKLLEITNNVVDSIADIKLI